LIAWELVTAAVNASRDPLALVTVINCWTGLGAPAGLEKMIEVVGTIRFVAGGGVTLRTTADSTVPVPTRTDTRPM
jgi:xanthine/CO dehydrogenase XdhC/CoxF family maturation factor